MSIADYCLQNKFVFSTDLLKLMFTGIHFGQIRIHFLDHMAHQFFSLGMKVHGMIAPRGADFEERE